METVAADFAEHFGHDVRYVGAAFPPDEPAGPRRVPVPEEGAWQAVSEQTKQLQQRGLAVCGGYSCGVFEQAKHWLGDEKTLVGMTENPRALREVLDTITEGKTAIYSGYSRAGVDIVWMGDDLGTQRSLVMSPRDYREWYRPRHAAIVQAIRQANPEVFIAFHCCGHVTPLIPDLIEIGIDCLEAVQAETMDISALKREFGRDIAFWGGVGAQSVLARPMPEEVRTGVHETLQIMSPGGGYIAAPCHTLTEEVPWENVVAFHAAMGEFNSKHDRGRRRL
jgi:uroporphyrinogen decarboxylase